MMSKLSNSENALQFLLVPAFVDIAFHQTRMSFFHTHSAVPSWTTSYDERVLLMAQIIHTALVS